MFRILPPNGGNGRQISEVVNLMMLGKTNNTGRITLRQNETTTVITDEKIGLYSAIFLSPTNADAATEVGAGFVYISSTGKGTATITHSSRAYDMKFSYAVIG
jgi:hypothetical protein